MQFTNLLVTFLLTGCSMALPPPPGTWLDQNPPEYPVGRLTLFASSLFFLLRKRPGQQIRVQIPDMHSKMPWWHVWNPPKSSVCDHNLLFQALQLLRRIHSRPVCRPSTSSSYTVQRPWLHLYLPGWSVSVPSWAVMEGKKREKYWYGKLVRHIFAMRTISVTLALPFRRQLWL